MNKYGQLLVVVAGIWLLSTLPAAADSGSAALDAWLDRQVTITTWSADVTQVRTLAALKRPLEQRGHVVFARPQRFRWQLGVPPRTLAVGTPDGLSIAYPRLKKLERYPAGDDVDPALRQVIDLLEVGFPTSADKFHERYELLREESVADISVFRLRPRSAEARRLLREIALHVNLDGELVATEFLFEDQSTIRNEFHRRVLDGSVDEELFVLETGEGWEISEPLGD